MTIKLDYPKKRIVLGWLAKGEINTLDMPELFSESDSAFMDLMKKLPDLDGNDEPQL